MKAQIIRKVSLAALLGFAAFAASATEWTYYAAGAEGNPTTVACITDGNWVLQVASLEESTGTITIGAEAWKCGIKKGSGILDLRGTVATISGIAYNKKAFVREACRKYSGLTEFHADGVTALGPGMFLQCPDLEKVSISGTATSIPDSADYSQAQATATFYKCEKLTSAVFNLPNLTYIGVRAFDTCSALKELVLSTQNAIEVSAEHAFIRVAQLNSVTIAGLAWTQTNLDRLLYAVTATTAEKNCTIYANKETWASLAATLTNEETAVKPEKCFGVYREGSRKAWLVANNEKHGFRIIIR